MSKYNPEFVKRIMHNAYTKGGVDACCNLANDVFKKETNYAHCKPCDCETPHIENECLCCGQ